MMRYLMLPVLALATASQFGQSSGETRTSAPEFLVASVKPVEGPSSGGGHRTSPTSFLAQNMTLRQLISYAYRVHAFAIASSDPLLDKTYTVEARIPAGIAPGQTRDMLQRLLEERFSLLVAKEPRSAPVYTLVKAHADGRLGPNLQPVERDCSKRDSADRFSCTVVPRIGQFVSRGMFWSDDSELIEVLRVHLDRLVIDRTGLSGQFDVRLEWMPNSRVPNANLSDRIDLAGPTVFVAVEEQLGLRLLDQREVVEVLVIKSVSELVPN